MNQPLPRHPLFVAIACIALAGAWSTGAYEAETGTSAALFAQELPPARLSAQDCMGPRGPARALCVFETTRPSKPQAAEMQQVLAPAGAVATPSALRVAARKDAPRPNLP